MAKYSPINYSIMKNICCLLLLSVVLTAEAQKKWTGFELIENTAGKKIDVLYKGRLLTAYRYDDSIFKPVLYPINSVEGITVTRGYPLSPRKGERTDHPHHIGMWLNYESVNGIDFWNNSTAIDPAKKTSYGSILHTGVESKSAHEKNASLVVRASWVNSAGRELLAEKTTYLFTVVENDFFIERITMLTAGKDTVYFKDVKDGLFAIRVARELEQPSTEEGEFIDAMGIKTKVAALPTVGITGRYTSSNGLTGDSVWGSQGSWVMLQGTRENKKVTIGIFDHPANAGYPAYWHARGYGLFSVNNLGRAIFSNGKDTLNLTLAPAQTIQFRYKVLISSGHEVSSADMEKLSKAFN
jgi:Methane oxygenase PmoA